MKNATLFESSYFESLVEAFRVKNDAIPEAIPPPIPLELDNSDRPPSSQSYLLPPVIIWDPAIQLSCFEEGIPCPHDSHQNEECFLQLNKQWKPFKTGKGGKELPRPLHGSEGVTFLVSRVYSCKRGHKIIAHDARIIEMIPDSSEVPFILFHRMGVTRELVNLVHSFIYSGMTFSQIDTVLAKRYQTKFNERQSKFASDVKAFLKRVPEGQPCEVEPFPEYNPAVLPSTETVMTSLLEGFQGNKAYFAQRMSEWSGKCITAGHLFKVCTTIGEKTADNKWVTHFDALYTVINEKGQVIAWQLTNKKSLDDVTGLLAGLQERLERKGHHLDLILVPDCCNAREKFTAVFGVDVPVKLDLKYAIQQVVRKIPEKKRRESQMTRACIHDFSLLFRTATDRGDERLEETPPPEEILGHLKEFLGTFKHMTGETGERLFPLSAIRQLDQLKLHIEEGCLSGIPPGSGTERTEELHSILKPVLEKKFLSTDMAVPLLSTLFYVWNERKESQLPIGAAIQPISAYKASLEMMEWEPTTEVFGTVGSDSAATVEGDYTFDVRALRVLIADALGETKEIHADCVYGSDTEKKPTDSLLKDMVLAKAMDYNSVQKQLVVMRRNPNFPSRLMHLLPCAVLLFSRHECIVGSSPSHDETLDKTLDLYKLSLADSGGMDSFFEAVAGGLDSVLAQGTKESEELKSHLGAIGYYTDGENNLDTNVVALRQIISTEWLSNHEDYHKLLVSPLLDFKGEAQNFSQCGYYKAEMANLLPLSAAKVLRIPIVIFTSLEHFPVVPVVPRDAIITSKSILVAYSALGCGTFYSVKPMGNIATTLFRDGNATNNGETKDRGIATDNNTVTSSDCAMEESSGTCQVGAAVNGSAVGAESSNATGDVSTLPNTEASMIADDSNTTGESLTAHESNTPGNDTIVDGSKTTANNTITDDSNTTGESLTAHESNTAGNDTIADGSNTIANNTITGDSNTTGESLTAHESNTAGNDTIADGSNTTANNTITGDSNTTGESLTAHESNTAGNNSIADGSNTTANNTITGDSNTTGESLTAHESNTAGNDTIADGSNTTCGNMSDSNSTGNITVKDVSNPKGAKYDRNTKIADNNNGTTADTLPINNSTPGNRKIASNSSTTGLSCDVQLKRSHEAARKRKWRRAKRVKTCEEKTGPIVCGCGRGIGNKAPERIFCVQTDSSQRMRCDCFRDGVGCSYNCRCIRCANPFGTCQEAKASCPRTVTSVRLRPKHKVQAIKSHVPVQSSSLTPKSTWSEIECLVFEHLLDLMTYLGLDLSVENIVSEHEHLMKVAKEQGSTFLVSKSSAEISQQLEVVQKNMQTFENLYKKQTELNWFQGMTEVCCMEVETS